MAFSPTSLKSSSTNWQPFSAVARLERSPLAVDIDDVSALAARSSSSVASSLGNGGSTLTSLPRSTSPRANSAAPAGFVQLDFDRIAGLDAQRVVFPRVFDRPIDVGIVAAGLRIEGPAVRPEKIGGGERRAVGPVGVVPQMERVGSLVGRDFPTFGDARLRLERFRVPARQALEQAIDDPAFKLPGDDRRIERFNFRSLANVKSAGGSGENEKAQTAAAARANRPTRSRYFEG